MLSRSNTDNINFSFQAINVLLLIFFLITLLPVVPITLIVMIFLYMAFGDGDRSEVYKCCILLSVMFAGAMVIVNIFIYPWGDFYNEIITVLDSNINNVLKYDLIAIIKTSFSYSKFSYMYMVFISFILGSYMGYRLKKRRVYEEVGMMPMAEQIKELEPKSKQAKIDKDAATLLGHNTSKKAVYCSDFARHVFVSGTTGSGKTVALSNFIKSGIEKDYGMVIVDGKGDTGVGSLLDIIQRFCNDNNRQLLVVNMNDPTSSDKYNPFGNASETMCKDMLINMTDWSEEHYKANAERYLQRLIKLLTLKGERLSFGKIIEYIPVNKFEELSNLLAKADVITKEQHLENLDIAKASGKITESAGARFATIAESELGNIFEDNGVDIYTAIEYGAVILFVLSPLKYPETSSAMGRLILIDAKQAVNNMFDSTPNRSFFIFDEINVYVSTALIDLINKSRSAGVTCIPATQSLADLEIVAGDAFKNQIIENCNNYLVLRQNSAKSAEEWAKTLGTKQTMQMTYQVTPDEQTGLGTAKAVREFIVHPDEIKAQKDGTGVFLSRDNGTFERLNILKPF